MQFQAQNIPRVTIYGAEFRGEWRFLPEWSLLGSAAYAHGQNEEMHIPIDSVDPFRIVGGLRYANPAGFGGEVVLLAHGNPPGSLDRLRAEGAQVVEVELPDVPGTVSYNVARYAPRLVTLRDGVVVADGTIPSPADAAAELARAAKEAA